ncbi:MAG: alpha-ketoglutarate-dependent dioxygenase AlkB [Lentisphaeraceae bacterium]|nr:alpha-ketoglutarate-dependent dioxygenase AlkB [Lentisphaeraceae bacterium]
MIQAELFGGDPQTLYLNEGKLLLYRNFFELSQSLKFLDDISQNTHWEQSQIHMFGNNIPIPRLNAWYADEGKDYAYSGIQLQRNNWSPALTVIKNEIAANLNFSFNSALLNLYRNGEDSVDWHADDEKELGQNPIIASVSLGQERKFSIRHKVHKQDKLTLTLPHNSLLIMQENLQHLYEHKVPKEKNISKPRLNITFRKIIS